MRRRRDPRKPRAGLASSRATWFRVTAAASSAAMLGLLGVAGTSLAATATAATATKGTAAKGAAAHAGTVRLIADSASSCHLGNGVKHVVVITFDNTHYFR